MRFEIDLRFSLWVKALVVLIHVQRFFEFGENLLAQGRGGEDFDIGVVLQRPIYHGLFACAHFDRDKIALALRHREAVAEPIEQILDEALVATQGHFHLLVAEHIGQAGAQVVIVEPVLEARVLGDGHGGDVANLRIGDPVHPQIAHVAIFFGADHKIVVLIVEQHRVGRALDDLLFFEFLFAIYGVVLKFHLFFLVDRLAYDVDVEKEILVVEFAPFVHGMYVFYLRSQLRFAEGDQLVDEVGGIFFADVLRAEHTVDQQPYFRIFERRILGHEIASLFATLDLVKFFEIGDVSPDGFALATDGVFLIQIVYDLLLRQRSVRRRMPLQDVVDLQYDGFCRSHKIFLAKIIISI